MVKIVAAVLVLSVRGLPPALAPFDSDCTFPLLFALVGILILALGVYERGEPGLLLVGEESCDMRVKLGVKLYLFWSKRLRKYQNGHDGVLWTNSRVPERMEDLYEILIVVKLAIEVFECCLTVLQDLVPQILRNLIVAASLSHVDQL